MSASAQQGPQSSSPGLGGGPLRSAVRLLRARQECIYSSITKLSRAYSLQILVSVTLGLEEVRCDGQCHPSSLWPRSQ